MSEKKQQSPVKQALFAIKELKAKLDLAERSKREPIAIVGMSCRMPGGASSAAEFWQMLSDGVDAVGEVPADRWNAAELYGAQDQPGKIYGRWGAFLDQIDQFDPEFFGISPREANGMDPQQRLLCETAWEALEDAGVPPRELKNTRTGVYMGVMNMDYYNLLVRENSLESFDAYTGTGAIFSATAGRISYLLGLQGPSIAVDNACSSSLVSTSLAVHSLRNNDCDVALAGGVNLFFTPETYLIRTAANMLSPTGRCHTFDARADGYVPGEGCGVIVLKRLSDALQNGDNIVATIRGVAINHDGPSSGLTVPNGVSQQKVIRAALANAGVQAEQIGYIEAHGTGTPLGDPIEINALGAIMAGKRKEPLRIASLKTNVGHMESAAGIGGLIKVALSLQHKQLPPHLHLNETNPRIDFDAIPAIVPQKVEAWPEIDGTRLAGVSSFSLTGTNAHIILEQGPVSSENPGSPDADPGRCHLLLFSAQSEAALREYARRYRAYLDSIGASGSLHDLSYTLARRRSHLEHRLTVAASSPADAAAALAAFADGEKSPATASGIDIPGRTRKLAFVFSGQGSQWIGMGRRLYESEPVFRAKLDEIDELLQAYTNWSLVRELQADSGARLDDTEVAQPAIFALQVALATLLAHYGVKAQAVVGHSVGEVAAAHVAGILDLKTAVIVIYHRSRLMQQATGLGRMAAASLSLEAARKLIAGREDVVAVGAHNGPTSVVFSGSEEAITEILAALPDEVFRKALPVNYAFHSPQMEPFRKELVTALGKLPLAKASNSVIAYPTAAKTEPGVAAYSAEYWGANVREAVSFAPAIQQMCRDGCNIFLEIGPHPVLTVPVEQSVAAEEAEGIALPTLRRDQNDHAMFLTALGALFTQGVALKSELLWSAGRLVTGLPAYPWQRSRYWLKAAGLANGTSARATAGVLATRVHGHPLLGQKILSPALEGVVYQADLSLLSHPYLREHTILGRVIFPGAGFLEMVTNAAMEYFDRPRIILENLSISQPLTFESDSVVRTVQLVLRPEGAGARFQIFSAEESGQTWKEHASGSVRVAGMPEDGGDALAASGPPLEMSSQIDGEIFSELPGTQFYRTVEALGFQYGAAFRGLRDLKISNRSAIGTLKITDAVLSGGDRYKFHPALLDSAIHIALAPLYCAKQLSADRGVFLPVGFESLTILRTPDATSDLNTLATRVRFHEEPESDRDSLHCDVELFDAHGPLAIFRKFLVKRANLAAVSSSEDWLYELQWDPGARRQSSADAAQPADAGTWLVVGAASFADELSRELGTVAKVNLSAASGCSGGFAEGFQVGAGDPAAWHSLLEKVFASAGSRCAGVVFAGGLELDFASFDPNAASDRDLDLALRTGCAALLHLSQALQKRRWSGGPAGLPRLHLITRGAQAVQPNAGADPLHAALWGQARVIAVENPGFQVNLIDLDPASAADKQIDLALREIQVPGDVDHVAWRDGKRFDARLVARRKAATTPAAPLIKDDASYLITGGLSGLGLFTAAYLARHGARHLILAGRREPDARALLQIEALRTAGISVKIMQCDVSKIEDVRRMIAATRDDGAAANLRGVVHSAGVIDDRLLPQMDWACFAKVLGPKAHGSLNLDRVLAEAGAELDFFVLFSSLTALVGTAGQSNYAAANAFMDALAHNRRARGLPALSINWGALAETGMATGISDAQWAAIGMTPVPLEPGFALLNRLLPGEQSQVAIAAVDWGRYMAQFSPDYHPGLLDDFVQERTADADALPADAEDMVRQLAVLEPGARPLFLARHIEQKVIAILALKSGKVDHQKGLFNIGMDSLMAVELKNRLQKSLGCNLPATIAFDYPNIRAMAAYILKNVLALDRVPAISAPVDSALQPASAPEPVSVASAPSVAPSIVFAGDDAQMLAELENLSDEAVEALLTERLNTLS